MPLLSLFSSVGTSLFSRTKAGNGPLSGGDSRNFLRVLADPADAEIDIVAIHGLNPLDKQSHAESTWTYGDKLWLRDFLPRRLPRARICLFGYNANVAFGSSTAGIREQAENMLNHLEKVRAHNACRPLVFICHSLGGLVTKRALVHAKNDATYRTIWESTYGLVFFSTPHQGGNNAGFGNVVAGITRCVSRNLGNTFMTALKSNSLFLSTITDDFRQLLEDFQILSFYETRPLGSFGLIVDRKSAVLGLPGTRERQIPIDADHRTICKFADPEDPRYKLVEDNIVQMISGAIPASHRYVDTRPPIRLGKSNRIIGHSYTVTQVGNATGSKTAGNENETDQYRDSLKCDISGARNTTAQVSAGATWVCCHDSAADG